MLLAGAVHDSAGEVLSAQLIKSSPFPPYDTVVPSRDSAKHVLEIDRAALAGAVEAAALVTTGESRAVRFAFTFNKLVVTARGPDAGESAIEVPCAWTGDPLEIALAPEYVLPALGAVDLDTVRLEFTRPQSPMVLRRDDGYVVVVMPISIV